MLLKTKLAYLTSLLLVSVFVLPHFSSAFGPILTLSTYSGAPNTSVLASGSGFAPHESVNLSIAGGNISGVTADTQGTFSNVAVVVPVKSAGNYIAYATGDHRNQAQANFYLSGFYPNAHPSLWYVLPGQSLSFAGTSFAPNEIITIANAQSGAATATVSGSGNFATGNMVVPFDWQGSARTFTVSGNFSGAHIPLTVTIGTFYPQIEPSTYYVAYNGSLTVNGHGFAPNEEVILMSQGTQIGKKNADGSGAVMFTLNAPSSGSNATLQAKGSLSNTSSSRTIYLH